MHPTIKIASAPARYGTYFFALVAVALSVVTVWRDGWGVALDSLPYVWLVFWAIFMLWWMPRLIVAPEAITVRNMLFTWTIPWDQFTASRLNLGLILETRQVDVRAAAARPQTGLKNMKPQNGPAPLPHIDEAVSSQMLDLDSAQAAELLRTYYERHLEAGMKPDGKVERKLNMIPLLAALVLLLLTFIPS
ncbi:MAG: PH domain-containing protein [Actinomycetaceae bacterium]|nr:PH domain-containing protein [Actinomycetaceae bacterium]